MRSRQRLHLVLLAAATLLGACADAEDPEIGALEAAQVSYNNLWWQDLATVAGDAKALMFSTFSQSATTKRMASTPEGRNTLNYLARCGLARGDRIVITDNAGNPTTFLGGLGLALTWKFNPLTTSQANWMAGCLAAHLNGLHRVVEISLRGNHPALALQQGEAISHPLQEGGFFGNRELNQYGCVGDHFAARCPRTPVLSFIDRICTVEPSLCNIQVVGLCRDVCAGYDGDHWWNCKGGTKTYAEVGTTYLLATEPITCRD
jgi:hypothetical protein